MTDVTTPYAPTALDTIRNTHRQKCTATFYPATGDPVELVINDGQVALAEHWSPHAQVQLSCSVGGLDAATLAAMDPRQSPILEVKAGYIYPGAGEDVHTLATTHLTERRVIQPGDGLELQADSAELLAQDVLWLEATQTRSYVGLGEAITALLAYVAPGMTLDHDLGAYYRPDLTSAVVLEQGQPVWDVLYHLALTAGLWLYVQDDGSWRLTTKATQAATTSVYLGSTGPGSIVTKLDDVLSRNGYYTAAMVRYQWKNTSGVDQEIVGTWAPTAAAGWKGSGQKTLLIERKGAISQFNADQAARLTVKNMSTRGASYQVDAVAAYWLRPGMTVQITLANGTVERHICKQVVFHLGSGSMTVTTREPSNLGES
jgi:hypothetical protein